MSAIQQDAAPRPERTTQLGPLRPLVELRTYAATLHLLLDLPLGAFWWVVMIGGLTAAGPLLLTLVGIPILAITLWLARAGGAAERIRARSLLGVAIEEPPPPPRDVGWLRRLRNLLLDPLAWRAVLYLLLLGPLGVATFTAAVTAWAVSLGLLTLPAWNWAIEGGLGVELPWGGDRVDTAGELALASLVGLVAVVATAWLVRGLGWVDGELARLLLRPSRKRVLAARVRSLEESRTRWVDAAAAERRRIERDLHDGAQQRLISLAVDLGRARERLKGQEETEVYALVSDAHAEAKRAIAELRDLARGIHPAILTDRGLDAALSSLAARAAVPVDVDVRLPERPPASVEAIAYFVVSEGLTNVARHSRASRAWVRVVQDGGTLVVEVGDDGVGGAAASPGSGLSGLADRLAAVDGRLLLASPPGGPTTIRAELPCGS
ncbi:MAG: sensor domain-containing protein [Thermoleophilia bacterium]